MKKITIEEFKELSWEEQLKEKERIRKEFAETIDFEPLYEEIRKVVKDSSIKFESEIVTMKCLGNRCESRIEIVSEELVDKVGIMGACFKSVKLNTFSSRIVIDKETLEPYWWGTIDFRYEEKSGGSNGIDVLSFELKDGKYYILAK